MTTSNELRILRPDDWHLHLRDGDLMRSVLPFSAELFGRAIIMPNINPPVRTVKEAIPYYQRIRDSLSPDHKFKPLMTCYLTDETAPAEVRKGYETGVFSAVKMYPAGATTNSEHGITDIGKVHRVFETMEELGMPLLLHGEVADPEVDVFDREAVFIDRILEPLRRDFSKLRIVLEHVTTRYGVEYVKSAAAGIGSTVTPHHLAVNRNALFEHGINPHMFCLPVVKREEDRLSLINAVISGDPRFFLGTDSAPHLVSDKEKANGSGGIFSAPTAIQIAAKIFEENGTLENLEAFVSINGARFYGMETNPDTIVLKKQKRPVSILDSVRVNEDRVKVFEPADDLCWIVTEGLRTGR